MPSDDLVLNVRQIAGYPSAGSALSSDTILLQRGGLGGPYLSLDAQQFVSTALEAGGPFGVNEGIPADSGPGEIYAGHYNTGLGGGSGYNAYYVPTLGVWKYLSSGPAATLTFGPNAGWIFSTAVAGSAGAVLGPLDQIFDVSANGSATLQLGTLTVARDPVAPLEVATAQYVSEIVGNLQRVTVASFNGRTGAVTLWLQDVLRAGAAPIFSPFLQGTPMAPTPGPNSNSERLATTAWVNRANGFAIDNLLATQPFVFTFNGRSGDVVLTAQDIIGAGGTGEIFDSPTFTGIPLAPTAAPGTNTEQISTTAFVQNAIENLPYAPINSPTFTGYVSAPTPAPGSSTGQLATTAFVMNAVAESVVGVASFNTRTGNVVLEAVDVTGAGGALLASPTFTGVPAGPTAPPGANSTQLATCAFVTTALSGVVGGVTSFNTRTGAITLNGTDVSAAGGALIASPIFSGTPQAPTAAFGNSSQQLATTAFVQSAILNGAVESFNGRTGAVQLTSADISAAGGAALQSPAFLGTPTAPTAAPGANTTQLATTAFVMAAVGVGAGVVSWNGRSGTVTLALSDVTAVGGAPLSSPAFSGSPTAPTAAPGNSSQALATTAFVQNALAGGVGVSTFNTRTGAVSLLGTDISGAGGALLASPAFTGSPTGPTAAPGNSSTQLATTAFVQAAVVTGAVASFNGRVGAVTLIGADVSAAGGALLASPGFSGTPTAPTATAGTNTTQIATTAFVETALNAAGGVSSFNGRAGVVTLTAADVSAAGGPYLALSGGTLTGGLAGTTAAFSGLLSSVGATLGLPSGAGPTINVNGFGANSFTSSPAAAGSAAVALNKAGAALQCSLWGTNNGSPRWQLVLGVNDAETGSNVGSSFGLWAYTDTGVVLGSPIQIRRTDGFINFLGYGASGYATAVGAGAVGMALNKAASGVAAQFLGTTNGVLRWQMLLGDPTPESGSNAGSNFFLNGYTDAGISGQLLGQFVIRRSDGAVMVNAPNTTPTFNPSIGLGSASLVLNRQQGNGANLWGSSNGVARWQMSIGTGVAESGSNAGSNFQIANYSDAGALIAVPLSIARATSVATFSNAIVNGPSDRTLKENIAPLDGALAKVKALQGVRFNFIGRDADEIGLIAQDVEPVVPEVIQEFSTGDERPKSTHPLKAIDYPKLVALLIEAVKELAAKVDTLSPART